MYELRLIYAQSQGKLQKKPRSEVITRVKIGRNKKNVTKKLRREMQENRLLEEQCAGCTVLLGTNFVGAPISSVFGYSFFLVSDLKS